LVPSPAAWCRALSARLQPERKDEVEAHSLRGIARHGINRADRRVPVRILEAELLQLLVQGVAIDPQPRRGLDLDAIAGEEHLLNQLPFHETDDAIVKVA